MKSKIKWLLIADGERAKILKREKLHHYVPVESTHHAGEVPLEKDLDAHKPGTVRQFNQSGGHMYSPHTDVHKYKKTLFAKQIAEIINHRVKEFDQLVIAAPSIILGELRHDLNKEVTQKIDREINKNLTKIPLDEIDNYLEK